MGNVAIYCRVSTQQQTTDRQKEELLKVAKEKGYNVLEKHIYVDVISGFKKGEIRPAFSQMITDVERSEIDMILFSEFSRLARNATELLQQINYFKDKNVTVFFEKQNIIVNNDNSNIGNTILLHVLAVMSSYEIELFTERTLSGKINKVQAGHGGGDEHAYGYCNKDKKITINEEEAEVVRTIFNMYAEGISSINIADFLNANNIPSPYFTRAKQFVENRKKKGLEQKEYKFNIEQLKWRANTIVRILSNKLYTGKRNITFYKPDPTNTLPTWKRENREKIFEYKELREELRIVSDVLFQTVQNKLLSSKYNKNNAIKHDNLLKDKLMCGECGGNFSVGNSSANSSAQNGKRTYKCYGIISRKDKKRTCETGSEIRQARLDGLVVTYCLKLFAEISIQNMNFKRIEQVKAENEQLTKILSSKKQDANKLVESYKSTLKKLIKVDNAVVQQLIQEETDNYNKQTTKLNKEISKIEKDIITNKVLLLKLERMSNTYNNLYSKMNEIREDKVLIKDMINEYIEKIIVYRIDKIWNLIVIKFYSNIELWGTIKAARYKNDEIYYNADFCKYGNEYKAWCIDNTEHCFDYDKVTRKVLYNGKSNLYKNFKAGEYNFEDFNKLLVETDNLNSYPLYVYADN